MWAVLVVYLINPEASLKENFLIRYTVLVRSPVYSETQEDWDCKKYEKDLRLFIAGIWKSFEDYTVMCNQSAGSMVWQYIWLQLG